jgi:hypothetical protein
LSDWLESLISRSDGILECRKGEEEYKDETRDPMFDHLRKRGVTAGPNQPIYPTIGLGMHHTGLGRASLPQKLARARLLARGLGPLVRTTGSGCTLQYSIGKEDARAMVYAISSCSGRFVAWAREEKVIIGT